MESNQNSTTIVCLCGSVQSKKDYLAIADREKASGKIVLMAEKIDFEDKVLTENQSRNLDLLQINKVRASDEVIIVNPEGEINHSTRNVIAMAAFLKKTIKFEHEPSQEILDFINNSEVIKDIF